MIGVDYECSLARQAGLLLSARNGYPGTRVATVYPVRTRVPGNFHYPVAVHLTLLV